MPIVNLTPAQFFSIASTLVAAAPVKEITPVIISAQVTVTGQELVAVATDRYRVARSTMILEEPAELDFEVVIPRAFLESTAKQIRALKLLPKLAEITLAVDDERVTISAPGLTFSAEPVRGNYPPVGRLFPDEDTLVEIGDVSLNAQFIADAGKLTHPALRDPKLSPIRLRFTASGRPDRPGLVLITRKLEDAQPGEALDYLLQPNLLLR